jgi:hypothetical protein
MNTEQKEKMDNAFGLMKLEQEYNSIKHIVDLMEDYGKPYKVKAEENKGWVLNPFENYDVETGIKNIRDDLMREIIEELSKEIPNVKINVDNIKKEMVEKLGEFGLSVELLKEIIDRDYISNAERLSLEEMFGNARRLLPVIWADSNRKKIEVKDILDKHRLKLEVSIQDYGWHGEHDYKFNEDSQNISALDKICGLVAYPQTTPITIDNSKLTDVLAFSRTPFDYDIDVNDRHIVKIRVYKNGKFILTFDSEENALKVAKALVGE